MVYKFLYKVLFFNLFIFFLLTNNILSKIIYDKNDIVITEIDLKNYITIYAQNKNLKLEKNIAIKKLVLQKNLLNQIVKNNSKFIEEIDDWIISNYGKETYSNENLRDFLRFSKVRNEFIIEYFNNSLDIIDIQNIINEYEEFKFPISNNNCLTISKVMDFKNDKKFINNFFENFKNRSSNIIKINGSEYDVCIDQKIYDLFEKKLIQYIEEETEDTFVRFVYGKQ